MKYDRAFFDAGIERRGTASEKWDDQAVCPEGTVPMWVADMDFQSAEPISQAILARAQHGCYGYTEAGDADAQALCDFVKRRHGFDIEKNQTAMMPCVVSGLRNAVLALTKPGERVAVLTPVYGPFYYSVEENGRVVERCPLIKRADHRYDIDFDRIEQALRSGVRLVMLCSPHNPVSRVWTRQELERVLNLSRQYGAALVVDEIHAEFAFAPHQFVSILELAQEEDQVICLMSASKTFNIAGLQQAMLICKNQPLLAKMKAQLRSVGATCGNIFALSATRAAYNDCDEWLDGLMDYLTRNLKILSEELPRLLPKAVLTPVEATYLAWIDLSAYEKTTKALMARCKRHKVAFTAGTFFGAEGEGYLRLNFGCNQAQLREGLKRLAEAMNDTAASFEEE